MHDEWAAIPVLFRQAQALTTLSNNPLIVVTTTESEPGGCAVVQERLAALSTKSLHRVAAVTHASPLDDPAGSVVDFTRGPG